MSKQVKTYGPAASAEPRELLLAKLIQNGKARGLKWTRGCEFRNAQGKAVDVYDDQVVSCCAAGAAVLEADTADEAGRLFRIELGNDKPDSDYWDRDTNYDGTMRTVASDNDAEDLGYAFRKAFR